MYDNNYCTKLTKCIYVTISVALGTLCLLCSESASNFRLCYNLEFSYAYCFVLILLLLKIHVTCWEQKMLHYFLRFVRLSEKVYNWVICIVDTSLTIILLNSIFCLQLFLDKIVLSHIQRNWFIFVNWILKSFITKTEKEINDYYDYMLKCI